MKNWIGPSSFRSMPSLCTLTRLMYLPPSRLLVKSEPTHTYWVRFFAVNVLLGRSWRGVTRLALREGNESALLKPLKTILMPGRARNNSGHCLIRITSFLKPQFTTHRSNVPFPWCTSFGSHKRPRRYSSSVQLCKQNCRSMWNVLSLLWVA